MERREFLLSVAAAALVSGCGSSPTGPGPVTPPPPGNGGTTDPPPPPPPPPVPVLRITRILAFGDSLTEGTVQPARALRATDAGKVESYPYKLQSLLRARYTTQSVLVINDGWAGKRADDDRDRLFGDLSEAKPDLLLLLHGANDLYNLTGVPEPALGAGIQKALDSVEDMVRDATGRGVPVMLATQPPIVAGLLRGGAAPFVVRYNEGLKAMASKKGAQIVDLFTLVPAALIGQDGLHLTEAGYQRVADVFLEAIKTRFETT